MTTPRSLLVDPIDPLHYHLVSRCVKRSFLCGRDARTGKDYRHRKAWLEDRMLHLAQFFAIEIEAFSILESHFHLVVYYDPTACQQWSDEEVARRWVDAFPPKFKGEVVEDLKPLRREELLADKQLLQQRRRKLGCLSTFMKHLKQPIALRANKEDDSGGHFFEARFYSGALLSDDAVLAAMAYVDLNPVRAKIARSLEQCKHTSIALRLKHLENSLARLTEALKPLASGIGRPTDQFEMTLGRYIDHLNAVIHAETPAKSEEAHNKHSRWFAQVASIHKRQRAYGSKTVLTKWIESRGWKQLGSVLP